MDRYHTRREKLRKALRKAGIDSLLVTNFTNVTYLTGFTGDDSYLLVTPQNQLILSDPRYTTQLEEECPGIEVSIRSPGKTMLQMLAQAIQAARLGRLGIEGQSMSVALRDRIAAELPKLGLVCTDGAVENLRIIKDKEEVEAIRRAVRCRRTGVRRAAGHHSARADRKGGGRRSGAPKPPFGGQVVQLSADHCRRSRGPPCRMPGLRMPKSAMPTSCWSIGEPTWACTRAT